MNKWLNGAKNAHIFVSARELEIGDDYGDDQNCYDDDEAKGDLLKKN